jgi:DNA-binding transcriptional MocR family regulator
MAVQTYLSGGTAVKIAESVEAAVVRGQLAGGDRLPPVREAAKDLGVSAATVAAAYRLLQERGVVSADGRNGTRVRSGSPVAPTAYATSPRAIPIRCCCPTWSAPCAASRRTPGCTARS